MCGSAGPTKSPTLAEYGAAHSILRSRPRWEPHTATRPLEGHQSGVQQEDFEMSHAWTKYHFQLRLAAQRCPSLALRDLQIWTPAISCNFVQSLSSLCTQSPPQSHPEAYPEAHPETEPHSLSAVGTARRSGVVASGPVHVHSQLFHFCGYWMSMSVGKVGR